MVSLNKLCKKATWIFMALGAVGTLTLSGCVYRFTNLHVQAPSGIRTIAFESIYDTSREVLPHELIWENFQKAFAADGHLQVVGRDTADALLRVHIQNASLVPTGTLIEERIKVKDEPKVFTGADPPAPSQFTKLPIAGQLMPQTNIGLEMRVEIFHLKTREKLLDRSYVLGATMFSVRDGSIPNGLQFVREEEAMRSKVDAMARQIAGNVVQDLLVH